MHRYKIQQIKELNSLIWLLPNTRGGYADPEESEAICFQPFSRTSYSSKSAFEGFRLILRKI